MRKAFDANVPKLKPRLRAAGTEPSPAPTLPLGERAPAVADASVSASSEGCPIFGYDPDSKGAPDIAAMQAEIFDRIRATATAAAGAAGA